MNLSDIHQCEKSDEKIVCITVDALGNTRCGYCGAFVPYDKAQHPDFKKFLKRLADEHTTPPRRKR